MITALRRLTGALRDAWHEGVYIHELKLRGPAGPGDELHWRRRGGGWTLHGALPPLPGDDDDPEVSRRSAPSSY